MDKRMGQLHVSYEYAITPPHPHAAAPFTAHPAEGGTNSIVQRCDALLDSAIFSDDSEDDADEILSNQPVDPVKTSEGANMALNRLVAEDFLESLGKELGLEVPPERPYVLSRPETLSAAGASVSSQNERVTTALTEVKESQSSLGMVQVGNTNEDAPLASAEKHDLKYEKPENRTEENRSRHMHRQSQNHSPRSDSSSERHRSRKRRSHHHIRNGTPESDSASEHHRNRRKSHSRHRKGRSRTPDTDSSSDTKHERKRREKRRHRTYTPDTDSSDHEHKERYKSSSRRSSDKDKSRKHSRHHKHRRKDHA